MSSEKVEIDAAFLRSFCQSVADMRKAQQDYFAEPGQYRLKVAKAKEATVDFHLANAKAAGWVKEVNKIEPTSGKLF